MPALKLEELDFADKDAIFLDGVVDFNDWRRHRETKEITGFNISVKITSECEHKDKHVYGDYGIGAAQWEFTRQKLDKLFGYNAGVRGLADADFRGVKIGVCLGVREYGGKQYLKVSLYKRRERVAAPQSEIDAIAERLGESPVERSQTVDAPSVGDAWKADPSETEDDLPF